MTNISKKPLSKKMEEKLFMQFSVLFSQSDKKRTQELFSSLLSPAERIMLVKRLAVVICIKKGLSGYQIARMLNMSETSIGNIKVDWENGRYDSIDHSLKAVSFDTEAFLKTIERILYFGLPPRHAKRWQLLDKINGVPKRK